MGHQGLATSFYNDRNEDIAEDLVKILMECDCEVPDFLNHLCPEDGKITFDGDATDDEAEDGEDDTGDSWGAAADGGTPVVAVANDFATVANDFAAESKDSSAEPAGFTPDGDADGASSSAW